MTRWAWYCQTHGQYHELPEWAIVAYNALHQHCYRRIWGPLDEVHADLHQEASRVLAGTETKGEE